MGNTCSAENCCSELFEDSCNQEVKIDKQLNINSNNEFLKNE